MKKSETSTIRWNVRHTRKHIYRCGKNMIIRKNWIWAVSFELYAIESAKKNAEPKKKYDDDDVNNNNEEDRLKM